MNRHDDYKLRQFLAARRAGDDAAARRWWDELVTGNFDRVRAWVILESRGRLSSTEQDDAVQLALVKLSNNMIATFRGTSMGEWVQSTRTLIHGACVDTQRRAQVVSRRTARLYATDDTFDLDRRAFEALEREREDEDAAAREAEAAERHGAFLDWAIPQLSDKRRAVIELDRQGVLDIPGRLGMPRDAVYQNRCRGLQDLDDLRGSFPA